MAWPTDVLDIVVEINIPTLGWTDITADVRRNDGAGVSGTDGTQGTEQRRAAPSRIDFELNNRDGKYSPRNPASPYYRLLTINTEIRVSVEGEYQFWGEVASGWPTKWTAGAPDAGDAWVPLRAGGRSERINGDTTPLRDPLVVANTSSLTNYPTFYWPLNDPASATQGASGDPEGVLIVDPPMLPYGDRSPVFGSSAPPAGLTTAPDFTNQGSLSAYISNVAGLGDFQVICWFRLEDGDTTGFGAMSLYQINIAVGAPTGFDVIMYAGLGLQTPGLDKVAFSCGGYTDYPPATGNRDASMVLNILSTPCTQGDWHELRVVYTESGGAITQTLYLDGTLRGSKTGSAASYSIGSLERITLNANDSNGSAAPFVSVSGVGLQSVASVAVYPTTTDPETYQAGLGYPGETAGARLQRLCDENEIGITFSGDPAQTSTMLAQRTGSTLSSLFDDCARTDGGLLHDARDALELRYVTRIDLYNRTAALALDYTLQAEVMPDLDVDESTITVENDVTATSDAGSVRRQQLTGPRNVTEPSDGTGGVGRYPGRLDTSLDTVGQLADAASWALWLGTTDAPRFTSIPVNLLALAAAGKTALVADAAAVQTGDVVTITNMPIWCPDDVICFAVGRSWRAANKEWEITYNTVDASAWQHIGGPLEDTVWGRADSEDSYLHMAATAGATTLYVANTGNEQAPTLWTSADGSYAIQIDDEIMTVTSVSTVAPLHVATGTAAYADNASVTPGLPGGATTNQHLLMLFAVARSPTTTVIVPAGWQTVSGSGGSQLYAVRLHDGLAVAPTVTFSGGSAGDTHGAVIASFRGLQVREPDAGGAVYETGSSQNINVAALDAIRDGCGIMRFGIKQDDWTSVATIAGATEVYDGSSTLGNDMGMVWDFQAQTTRAAVAAATFTVSGGASATWDSYIMIIDGNVQAFTVTRGAEGTTAAAHAVGSQVRLAHPMRWGR